LGAALALWYLDLSNERKINSNDDMNGSYLGPEFTQNQIEEQLTSIGAIYETVDYEKLINRTSGYLSNENVIGWFQGRMEFGPRALGGRSILGDPRSEKCKKT
jgi:carbamoyltransferase